MAKPIVEMEVERVTVEVPTTKTIRLKWPAGYDVEFKTGQFITLYWPDTPAYKRAYSLSSCALDRGFYDISVQRDGKMGTRLVDWIKPGDRLMVIPPTGRFLPAFEPDRHLLCLAGGSGVTPFRGFVREATQRRLETRITILYSARTSGEIIFRDEFEQLAATNPRFVFRVTCTRQPDSVPWPGRVGRITKDWIAGHLADLPRTVFYACGSNAFVEAVEELLLRDLGAARDQVRAEKWG
jgi:ferredoxin-NADP reductase